MRIENNGVNLGNAWTLTAWAKNLLPPSSTGKSSLFRGQDKQGNRDYDRYLTIRGSDRTICFFDGDVGNINSRYRPTIYKVDPLRFNDWHHFAVVGTGSQTKYFVDGEYVGFADRREQSDVYYIGNSSDNEAFAEFIDDVRIYGISIDDIDINRIYGGGFGDMRTSIMAELNSSVDTLPQVAKLSFGQDGQSVSVGSSYLSPDDFELKIGSIGDINSTNNETSYLISVNSDQNNTHNSIQFPSTPLRFNNLSLWLDANDSILDAAPFSLWVDANDTSTITTVDGGNDVLTWACKTDSSVKLHGGTHKPNTGANINGLNAINFDFSPNKEQVFAKKNDVYDWNPAGVSGSITGSISDVSVFMALQVDSTGRTYMPFNFGWGSFSME